MKTSLGSWMLLSLACISQATSAPEKGIKYAFATRDYSIEMKITFLDPYVGQRLSFSSSVDSGKEICFSSRDERPGPCIERFVGAVAVVRYSVKPANGGKPNLASIRERVTVSAQSSGLPPRPPFSMTQKLVKGIGSDLQVFGYDEGPLKKSDRMRTRKQAQTMWWRLCRQELYIGGESTPFAIVEWKHTVTRISIVHIDAPPYREWKRSPSEISGDPLRVSQRRATAGSFGIPRQSLIANSLGQISPDRGTAALTLGRMQGDFPVPIPVGYIDNDYPGLADPIGPAQPRTWPPNPASTIEER